MTADERSNRLILSLALLIGLGGGGGYRLYSKSSEEQAANRASLVKLEEEQLTLKERLVSSRSQLEQHQNILETRQQEFETARAAWDSDRSSLMEERERLVGRIETLANKKETTNVDLEVLREQLEETTRHLSLYDPVNLEQARLREVARINRAVVMVEAKEVLKQRTTGEILYISEDEYGFADFNFDGEGEPLAKEASGSGFCLSDDGYVLTNAHVVKSATDIRVRQHGSAQRLRAHVVAYGPDVDLAILELDGEVFSLRISDSDNSVPRILTNRPFRVSAMFGLRLAVFMFTSSILSTQSTSFTSSTSTTPSTPSDFSRVNH